MSVDALRQDAVPRRPENSSGGHQAGFGPRGC
jgi:hypothetical protein